MKLKHLLPCFLTAVFALVSCNGFEDIEYLGIPKISLSEVEMMFDVSGGDEELTIKANRPWKIETFADWVIVDPDSGEIPSGEQTVTVSVLENAGYDRVASLTFTLGMRKKILTVSQAGELGSAENLILYHNDFDKTASTQAYGSSGTSWPYLDQFDGWKNETGTGVENVEYSFKGMSARDNSNSDGSYSDYAGSGTNNLLFGASAYFAVRKIALDGATDFTLTFGTEKYSQNDGSIFTNSEFHIYLSADDKKWVELTDYTFAGGQTSGRWNVATAHFSVPEGTSILSICMKPDVASAYRLDDLQIVKSDGGAEVDFSAAVEMDFGASVPGGGGTGGNESDADAIYSNNYDKSAAEKGDGWPYLDQSDVWKNAAGTGAANVTYESNGVSVRNNSNSNGSYSDYAGSGLNNLFFGAKAWFSTNNIALGGAKDLVLTFGTEKYSQTSGSVFTNSEYHIWLSADGGEKWVELTDYTFAGGTKEGRWNVATAEFSVPDGITTLSICMQVDVASAYRLDDMKLVESQTPGKTVDFSNAVAKDFSVAGGGDSGSDNPPVIGGTVVPISQVLAAGANAVLASGTVIEATVISNMALNNLTSKKGLYVQDETAGLQFYLAENHSFAFGDKLKIDLSGAKIGAYNGAVQISGLALSKISKISSGNTVTPLMVSVDDFMANKYEGQYIALEGVQVASSDLSKTFVTGGAHTSINMETRNGKTFVVFSSKYATFGTSKVPQGSGTLKGISSISNGKVQIIFAQNSDYDTLAGERFDAGTSGGGSDDGGEVTPPVLAETNRADFETLDKTSSYNASLTSEAGWTLTNSAVQEGGEKDSNPVFTFLGKIPGTDTWAKAACINGKTSTVGSILSPELTGGCGTLTFNYGHAFQEANGVDLSVHVITNNEVVLYDVKESSVPQKTALTFSGEIGISGTFRIRITNNCPSKSADKNKDRVSIWNLTWTPYSE